MDNKLEKVEKKCKAKGIYYVKETLTHSREGRNVDLLTISSFEGQLEGEKEALIPGLFPNDPAGNS